MKKRTLILLALAMVMLLTVSVFAVAQIGKRITPKAVYSWVDVTKTFDIYGVICTSGPCAEEGKCLGTMDGYTCLSVCGLQFTQPNTEYRVYDEAGNLVGSSIGGVVNPVCICRNSSFGRVRYTLSIQMKNPGKDPSWLSSITLCLAATDTNYVGSDYEQIHDIPVPTEGATRQSVILPDPTNVDNGQNVILCQLCP